jgi:tRNA (adenine9-N1/guanine9-N1)-methyltransferase
MRLKDVFIEMLGERGIERISSSILKIVTSTDPLRMMALYIANGKANICFSSKTQKASFNLNGEKVYEPPQAYVGYCSDSIFTREELVSRCNFPYIVVDCRFYDLHSEKEKRKLLIQIQQTLSVVRKYMWDEKLIVTRDFGYGTFYPSTEEFLKEKGIEEVLLLDPGAKEVFTGEYADCYVIGGIVDKSGNKRGLTSKMGEELEKAGFKVKSRKILLRGDVVGVPDRINHIAEILLKVVLDCEELEKAIREVQPPVVAKWRLRKELHDHTVRFKRGDETFRIVPKSTYYRFNWLNLSKEDFYEVCSQQRFIVVSDEIIKKALKSNRADP